MPLNASSLDDYPVTALPECVRPLVLELAKAMNCSVSLPATLALGMMAGAAGRVARIAGVWPCLWALVKAEDDLVYRFCWEHLCAPLWELETTLLPAGDIICMPDDGEDYPYQTVVGLSPDASVLVPIQAAPRLCEQGWKDGTLSCVGRMAGELWLQPGLWSKLLSAEANTGNPQLPAGPGAISAVHRTWTNAIRAVLKKRIEFAGQPAQFEYLPSMDALVDQDDHQCLALRLACLLALFRVPGELPDMIREDETLAALRLKRWHDEAKRRLWEDAQRNPWQGAFFGQEWGSPASSEVLALARRCKARKARRIADRGVATNSVPDGIYTFRPDPNGIPCGLIRFSQVHGTALTAPVLRQAINDLESLAEAANTHEMNWPFGIWQRTTEHNNLAAAVQRGSWCGLLVWRPDPLANSGASDGRFAVKNLWVAKSTRRKSLATRLVASVAALTGQEPHFDGPFTEAGRAFAQAWYGGTSTEPAQLQASLDHRTSRAP